MHCKIILFFLLFSMHYLRANFYEITSISQAESIVASYISKALILLDIDDTLMIAQDKVMRNANIAHHERFMSILQQQPKADHLINTVFQSAKYQLVEEQWTYLVEQWKKEAIAVFGCTARHTGKFILESTVEDWTGKRLSNLGIVFSKYESTLPNFKYGILFCGPTPKGIALLDFLPELTQDINTIIMIDDKIYHLENINAAIAQWNLTHATNINFIGFHYTAATYLDNAINIPIIERQLAHLVQTGVYVSEATVSAMA